MDSVDPLTSSLYFSAAAQAATKSKKKDEGTQKTAAKKRLFSDFLRDAEEKEEIPDLDLPSEIIGLPYEKAVATLLDSVYSTGDELRHNQTPEMVQKYRKSVKYFIHYVVKNCYYVEKHESSRSVKKRKKFYQIEVVDKKLDKLAAEVLMNQREQIAFLAKIDEINGILVDLIT